MAQFEEFKVTRRKDPSRFGVVGALVVFGVYFFNYGGPAGTREAGSVLAVASAVSDRPVRIERDSLDPVDLRPGGSARGNLEALDRAAPGLASVALGAGVVAAVPLALLGPVGIHLLYALVPALAALLLYGLVAQVFGRRWLAFAGQLLGCLNPFLLSWQGFSENMVVMALLLAACSLLLRPPWHSALLGLFLGAMVGIRPAGLIFLPAIAVWILTERSRRGLARWGALGLVASGLVVAALPLVLQGDWSLGLFEAEAQDAHALWGIGFRIRGLLNVPFVESPVRTPHFPFPTFLTIMLALARSFGLVLSTVFFLGVSPLFREDRRLARFLMAWILVPFAAFGIREDWDEQQMSSMMLLIPPVTLFILAGLLRFGRLSALRENLSLLVLLGGVLFVMVRGAVVMEFRPDPRWAERHPAATGNRSGLDGLPQDARQGPEFHTTRETPEELSRQKRRLTRGGLLPAFYLPVRWEGRETLREFGQGLADPTPVPRIPFIEN